MASSSEAQRDDELTIQQQERIRVEIAAQQPMIGPMVNPIVLLEAYENAELEGFKSGIEYLVSNKSGYSALRKVRGDGNCFYRAFLFGYLENLLAQHSVTDPLEVQAAEEERARFLSLIENSMTSLTAVGYSEFAIESFHDELVELIKDLFSYSRETLLEQFQEGGSVDCYTWYMRVLTAGYIKADGARFLPFVEGLYFDIDSFCKAEVEPMHRECEQIQIIALAEFLKITAVITYLDGRTFDEATGLAKVILPEPSNASESNISTSSYRVHLLYRPGHYDILYK